MNTVEAVRNGMVAYRMNLRTRERLLIVADTLTPPDVLTALMTAGRALDLDVTLTVSEVRPFHHADPDEMSFAAMREADLIHLVTSKGMIHAPRLHSLQKSGKKVLASEEITLEMLTSGAATADYERMNQIGATLRDIFLAGTRLRIESSLGTHLEADIANRPPWLAAGRVLENPGCDLTAAAFPDGEVGIAPLEESIEGVVVWDTSMHQVGLLNSPITAEISRGRVIDLRGGVEAATLRSYLERHGDDGSWVVGETAVGLNPDARVTGVVREDKKLAGSVHVALGMNTDVGGANQSRTHIDGVIRRPSVEVDGRLLVDSGEFVLEAA